MARLSEKQEQRYKGGRGGILMVSPFAKGIANY